MRGKGKGYGLSPLSLKVALGELVKLVGILYHSEPRKLPIALGLKNSIQNQGSQISCWSRSGRLKARHTHIIPLYTTHPGVGSLEVPLFTALPTSFVAPPHACPQLPSLYHWLASTPSWLLTHSELTVIFIYMDAASLLKKNKLTSLVWL